MIFDFDRTETATPEHADVCILGAGAAGVALAVELAARGLRVTVLEGGGAAQEQRSQQIYASDVVAQPHRGIHHGRFRTLGGTTTRWGGQILELQPMDFERRDWIAGSGWPFSKPELAPFYERALQYEGLRRVERNDETVWHALGLDGSDAQFVGDAFALQRDAFAPELAMMYSRWLPVRDVAELHRSTLRDSRRIGLYLHASAVGFRMNPARDRVDAMRVRGFSGRTAEVSADAFVICLGGIESTRLLLQPEGDGSLPWQTNGLLGKHYQDHIAVNRIPLRSLRVREPWRLFGYNTAAGFRYHNKLWLVPDEQRRLRTLNVAGTITPDAPASTPEHDEAMARLREIVRRRERPSMQEAMRLSPHALGLATERAFDRFRDEHAPWRRATLTVHSEQEPSGASTISLGDERDELGLFRTRLDWRISQLELHTVRSYVRVAMDVFSRAGLAQVHPPVGFFEDDAKLRALCEDSFHHMGGTRMSASPDAGIVDPALRLHGVANAYVCSSSAFPSSGYSNPTHTLLALTMRLADALGPTAPVQAASIQTGKLRLIELPSAARPQKTTQLGFGCAYLLGPGLDRDTSRRLLDAAWDAGIRHFDCAPLYGMGHTEALLGEFLRTHPDATVTTKFGVLPPTAMQRNLMRAGRVLPAWGRLLPMRDEKAVFSVAAAQQSLEASLRALGRDHVDLFLLHEAEAADLVHDDLLAWMERKRDEGVIGNFGFGGAWAKISLLLAHKRAYVPVLQYERSLLTPTTDTGVAWCAYYRTFAAATRSLTNAFDRDPALLRRWSEATGFDLSEPPALARLVLRATLDAWPNALQLFSTASEHHIVANVQAATDSALRVPAERLAALISSERETFVD